MTAVNWMALGGLLVAWLWGRVQYTRGLRAGRSGS